MSPAKRDSTDTEKPLVGKDGRVPIMYLAHHWARKIIVTPVPDRQPVLVGGGQVLVDAPKGLTDRDVNFTPVAPRNLPEMLWGPDDRRLFLSSGNPKWQERPNDRRLWCFHLRPKDDDYDAIRLRIEGRIEDGIVYTDPLPTYSPNGPTFHGIWRLDVARERRLEHDRTIGQNDREKLINAIAAKSGVSVDEVRDRYNDPKNPKLNFELQLVWDKNAGVEPVIEEGVSNVEVGLGTAGGAIAGLGFAG